ncbi:MAG: DUF3783 domain-containing protein [Lachnospira sp.]
MILYNIDENMLLVQKERIFLEICQTLNISTRQLKPDDLDKAVGALAGIPNIKPIKSITASKNYVMPEILIFSGLKDKELDDFLEMYKSRGLSEISLKAVATPHNISWSLYQLICELEEHKNKR